MVPSALPVTGAKESIGTIMPTVVSRLALASAIANITMTLCPVPSAKTLQTATPSSRGSDARNGNGRFRRSSVPVMPRNRLRRAGDGLRLVRPSNMAMAIR